MLSNFLFYLFFQIFTVANPITAVESYTIIFEGIEVVYNDHVGNEWTYYIEVDGARLFKGMKTNITLTPPDEMTLPCFLSETEEKYNDSAIEHFLISIRELSRYKGNGF